MSGPLAAHRTGNRPLFEDGEPVYKKDALGWVYRWVTKPGGVHEDGRCVEWRHELVPVQRHVLDYSPQIHRPSKHAAGRTRPRTPAERRRVAGLEARMTQFQKRFQLDLNRMAAELA